jgi:hypothetical protein
MEYCVFEVGHIFNSSQILTFNILKNAREAPRLKKLGFDMSSYLIDLICSSIGFPSSECERNHIQLLLHIYFSQLWDINYKKYIHDIREYFLVPLFIVIFNHPPHRVSQGAITIIKEIDD